ncbi:MAG: cytochrome c [Deltaproteobacteria bacterium]|nr:cytochrome c [Deltaproteobacteria bacterium]
MASIALGVFLQRFDSHPADGRFDLVEINTRFAREFEKLPMADQNRLQDYFAGKEEKDYFQALQRAIHLKENPPATTDARRFAATCSACHSLSIPLGFRWESGETARDIVKEMTAFAQRTLVYEEGEITEEDRQAIVRFLLTLKDPKLPVLVEEEEKEGESNEVPEGKERATPLERERIRATCRELAKAYTDLVTNFPKVACGQPLNFNYPVNNRCDIRGSDLKVQQQAVVRAAGQMAELASRLAFYRPSHHADDYKVYQAFSNNLEHLALLVAERIEANNWIGGYNMIVQIARHMRGAHEVFQRGLSPDDPNPKP